MMKIYISPAGAGESYKQHLEGKTEFVSSISQCDKLLVFPAQNVDVTRQDIYFALGKKKRIVYVKPEGYVFDKGLEMQLALEKGFLDTESPETVTEEVLAPLEAPKKRGKPLLYTMLALVVVIGAVLVFLLPGKPDSGKNSGLSDKAGTEASDVQPSDGDSVSMDPALLDALLRLGLDADGNGLLSEEELSVPEELDLSGRGLTDITALVYAVGLRKLNLSDNEITEIQALVSLVNLEELDLRGNPIEDYEPLAFLTGLKTLERD